MINLIDNLPDDIEQAIETNKDFSPGYKGIKNVCIGGMGGSAIGGDIALAYAAQVSDIPFSVIRGYDLPKFVDGRTLFLGISYSGNTEETITLYKKAKKKKAKVVIITSNGVLEDLAKKENVPLVLVPKGYPPRAAIGYLFIATLFILKNQGIIDVRAKDLKELTMTLRKEKENARIWAENMSQKVKEKIPFIYAPGMYLPVAKRWVTQINENSKALAHFATFPELDHNEIVGWENPREILKRFFLFVLRDKNEDERLSKRINATLELIKDYVSEIVEIYASGESFLAKVFSLIQKGDYLSYFLALNYGMEPLPVKRIEELKRIMAE